MQVFINSNRKDIAVIFDQLRVFKWTVVSAILAFLTCRTQLLT